MFATIKAESAPGVWECQSLWSRVKDLFTAPMTGNEFDFAHATMPNRLKAYHRGVISDRELARIVRSYTGK